MKIQWNRIPLDSRFQNPVLSVSDGEFKMSRAVHSCWRLRNFVLITFILYVSCFSLLFTAQNPESRIPRILDLDYSDSVLYFLYLCICLWASPAPATAPASTLSDYHSKAKAKAKQTETDWKSTSGLWRQKRFSHRFWIICLPFELFISSKIQHQNNMTKHTAVYSTFSRSSPEAPRSLFSLSLLVVGLWL